MPVVISKDILCEEFESESLLLDLKTNRPYILNEMASVVFKLMRNRMDDSGIAQALCDTFAVSNEQALADVHFFRNDLIQKGILETGTLPIIGRFENGFSKRGNP